MEKHRCPDCRKAFKTAASLNQHWAAKHAPPDDGEIDPNTEPDWDGECEVCGQSPIVPITGLCGPCTWGEADTIGGNW